MEKLRSTPRAGRLGLLVAVAVGAFACLALLAACGQDSDPPEDAAPESVARPEIDVSDAQSCRECHEEVYQLWEGSHHHLANRRVDPERDGEAFAMGEFQDAAGREYRVRHDADGFFISEKVSGEWREVEVDSVIGETPLRQFLVNIGQGRLQTHAMSWDPEKKEWFNVFGDEERLRGEWGHWTGQGMNWNANCAACHMTDYEKRYEPLSDSYATEWSQQGISCVRCHEDMDTHVIEARKDDYQARSEPAEFHVMDNCASCHSRRTELTKDGFGPGQRFHDHYRLMLADQPGAYFESGQANEENYVYGSLMMSRMGHMGVSCLDCHDPHSHQLKLPVENNALCISCHSTGLKGASLIDPVAHSGHPADSAGNQCVQCHMPERVYMDRDWRRDHGFTTPDPILSEKYGVPNACSDCHDDQSEEWVRDSFHEMFGESERLDDLRERAAVMHAVNAGEEITAETLLGRFQGEENPYWRATWLRVAGARGLGESFAEIAAASANAESPLERAAALDALSETGGGIVRLREGLNDPARVVRIQAADALNNLGAMPGETLAEWVDYTQANADNPAGALRLAEVEARSGNRDAAEQMIRNAVSFDRASAALRYDAAILLNRMGLVEPGIVHLRVARNLDPSEGRYAYALGLLYGESGDWARSAESFAAALQREPEQDRWWYQLAIAQVRSGEVESALGSLERALELSPENAEYEAFLQQLRR